MIPLTSEKRQNTCISSLPPEILLEILSHFASGSSTFILSGQFTTTSPVCKLCSYRNIASVSKSWKEIMEELFWSELVLGGNLIEGKEGAEGAEGGFWKQLIQDGKGRSVRKVDASLRIWSQQSQFEKAEGRESRADKDRSNLRNILSVTPLLRQFDADFAYLSIQPTPYILPSTIRTLTLRNSQATDTIQIINQLPFLTNLTIRLALDFFHPPSSSFRANCSLEYFSLSVTAWGETDSFTIIQAILSNSKESLRSLTLRNKSASSVEKFLPVGQEIMKVSGGLKELRILDIPRDGFRKQGQHAVDWFALKPTPLPNLLSLHLCGTTYSPALFSSLQCPSLHQLIIEDFDCVDGLNLLKTLETEDIFEKLKVLKVCTRIFGWSEEGRNGIERLCEEKDIELIPSWKLRRIEKDWY